MNNIKIGKTGQSKTHSTFAEIGLRKGTALVVVPRKSMTDETVHKLNFLDFLQPVAILGQDKWSGRSTNEGPDTPSKNDILAGETPGTIVGNVHKVIAFFIGDPLRVKIDFVFVDELQNVADRTSYTELVLSIVRFYQLNEIWGCDLICASATIGNPEVLADWLDAKLLYPPDYGGRQVGGYDISYARLSRIKRRNKRHLPEVHVEDVSKILARWIHKHKYSRFLIFSPSRRGAEELSLALAKRLSIFGRKLASVDIQKAKKYNKTLSQALNNGISFYHARLNNKERLDIDSFFREGKLSGLVGTTSLAQGVNLCVDFVAVIYPEIYTTGEICQMMGRTGREKKGDVLLLPMDQYYRYRESLIEPIISQLTSFDVAQYSYYLSLKFDNISVPLEHCTLAHHQGRIIQSPKTLITKGVFTETELYAAAISYRDLASVRSFQLRYRDGGYWSYQRIEGFVEEATKKNHDFEFRDRERTNWLKYLGALKTLPCQRNAAVLFLKKKIGFLFPISVREWDNGIVYADRFSEIFVDYCLEKGRNAVECDFEIRKVLNPNLKAECLDEYPDEIAQPLRWALNLKKGITSFFLTPMDMRRAIKIWRTVSPTKAITSIHLLCEERNIPYTIGEILFKEALKEVSQ